MSNARNLANLLGTSTTIPSGKVVAGSLPAGSVLQVVQATTTTQQTLNTGTTNNENFVDIGLSLSITPSSTSNKIYLMASVSVGQKNGGYNNSLGLFRGSTLIGAGLTSGVDDMAVNASWRSSSQWDMGQLPINFLDSPSTTSAITYAVKCNNNGGSSYPSYINRSESGNTFGGNPSSTLLAMEIAG